MHDLYIRRSEFNFRLVCKYSSVPRVRWFQREKDVGDAGKAEALLINEEWEVAVRVLEGAGRDRGLKMYALPSPFLLLRINN